VIFKYGTITLFGTPFQEASFNQTLPRLNNCFRKFNWVYLSILPREQAPDAIFLQPPPLTLH